MSHDTTLDGILNRRVLIEQPARGYRVAIDTVLLAAAVPIKTGESALDMGCGVGGAMLALACRVPDVAIAGLEIQSDLAELCRRNIVRNGFQDRLKVICEDVQQTAAPVALYHHVLMNPPYHDDARHDVSSNTSKRTANTSHDGDLPLWIMRAAECLGPDGILTLIHRADRLPEILDLTMPMFGQILVRSVCPTPAAKAKRVLVRAYKNKESSRLLQQISPLILHQSGGTYTDEAEQILRHMAPLGFSAPFPLA